MREMTGSIMEHALRSSRFEGEVGDTTRKSGYKAYVKRYFPLSLNVVKNVIDSRQKDHIFVSVTMRS